MSQSDADWWIDCFIMNLVFSGSHPLNDHFGCYSFLFPYWGNSNAFGIKEDSAYFIVWGGLWKGELFEDIGNN